MVDIYGTLQLATPFISTIIVGYFVVAGITYLLFYKTSFFVGRKIDNIRAKQRALKEMGWSTVTCFVWGILTIVGALAIVQSYTLAYVDIHKLGIPYFLFSIILLVVLHDTYFYWAHRAMHAISWLRPVHKIHHDSVSPTPWAAYSFSPSEAILHALFPLIIIFVIPIHIFAIYAWLIFMIMMNILGHLGYEILPKNIYKHWLFGWLNTTVAHNMHHHYGNTHFGLYFLFWDRILHTLHSKYHEQYDLATGGQ